MRSTCRRVFVVFLFVLLTAGAAQHARAKDNWVRLKSANFVLVGNADQKKIRDIAIKLEQYRYAFTQLLPTLKYESNTPSTIMVFKDMKSFGPFRVRNAAGYFQPGEDMDYLALAADQGDGQSPYGLMFHEYTHLLIHNSRFSDVPDWFNEGLSEYYSTFEVTDDRQVRIGAVASSHLLTLRQESLLPLSTLFDVDHNSPYYNEVDKQSLFYAESWLLVHYLIQGDDGAHVPQLGRFLDLLLNQVPAETAFTQAFNTTYADMEKALRGYLRQTSHRLTQATFKDKLGANSDVALEPVDEATAQTYQGDLALHAHLTTAEQYLRTALSLDPNNTRALLALGRYNLATNHFDEALPYLEKAIATDSQNPYAAYYYGEALIRKHQSRLPQPQIDKLRVMMKAALSVEPVFSEAVRLYGYLALLDGQGRPDAIAQLQKALTSAPRQHQLRFVLAQLFLAEGDLSRGKLLLQAVAKAVTDAQFRAQVEGLIAEVDRNLALIEEDKRAQADAPKLIRPPGTSGPVGPGNQGGGGLSIDIPTSDAHGPVVGERTAAPGETRLRGQLIAIECTGGNSVTLVVKTEQGMLRLHNRDLQAIDFRSFSAEVASGSEITCGPRKMAKDVFVTFTATAGNVKNISGTVVAVEFVGPPEP